MVRVYFLRFAELSVPYILPVNWSTGLASLAGITGLTGTTAKTQGF